MKSIFLPKMLPLFYKECLNDWANFKATSTWNNKVICVAEKALFKKNLVNKGTIKLKLVL